MTFKSLVRRLIDEGVHPGPKNLRLARGLSWNYRISGHRNINGRQTRWRNEVLQELGWTKHNNRWRPPR